MQSILKIGVSARAVLSITDWCPPPKIKTKNIYKPQNPNQVHMHIMKTVIFRKQIELTVMIGQWPAGLVKPEP